MDLFRVPWNDLTLEAVQTFLSEQVEEGLLWEVKRDPGGKTSLRQSVGKAVCGMANSEGGYVVIGVQEDRRAKSWTFDGFHPEGDEAALWLTQLVEASFVRPPAFDTKAFKLADSERYVGVIRVSREAMPPCVTVDGQVYKRLSGKTVPVQDPHTLAELVELGRSVNEQARQSADAAVRTTLPTAPLMNDHAAGVFASVALSATSFDEHVESVVFGEQMRDQMLTLLEEHAELERQNDRYRCRTYVRGDRVSVVGPRYWPNKEVPIERLWIVNVGADGTMSAHCRLVPWKRSIDDFQHVILDELLAISSKLLMVLNPVGALHVALGCVPNNLFYNEMGVGHDSDQQIVRVEACSATDIAEMSDGRGTGTKPVELLMRHLRRSVGLEAWEPAPPVAD